jgi:hypothetical protein
MNLQVLAPQSRFYFAICFDGGKLVNFKKTQKWNLYYRAAGLHS